MHPATATRSSSSSSGRWRSGVMRGRGIATSVVLACVLMAAALAVQASNIELTPFELEGPSPSCRAEPEADAVETYEHPYTGVDAETFSIARRLSSRGSSSSSSSGGALQGPRRLLREAVGGGKIKQLLYINRHQGTLADFKAACNSLGCNWMGYNPAWNLGGQDRYGMDEADAHSLYGRLYRNLCSYDVFVVSDTIVDARPLLANGACGGKPVILQVTNRFDYRIRDHKKYYDLMAHAATLPNVWWIPNNPYEQVYLARRGVRLPPSRTRVIRPLGYSPLKGLAQLDLANASVTSAGLRVAAVANLNHAILQPAMDVRGVAYTGLKPRAYGGPHTLARFDAIVDLPYQCSVMSLVENLAAGVVYMVPSASFMVQLLTDPSLKYVYACFDKHDANALDLDAQVELIRTTSEYHAELFAPYMLHFDSWDQLAAMLGDAATLDVVQETRRRVVERFRPVNASDAGSSSHGQEVLGAWRQLLTGKLRVPLPSDLTGCGVECSALGSEDSDRYIQTFTGQHLHWKPTGTAPRRTPTPS